MKPFDILNPIHWLVICFRGVDVSKCHLQFWTERGCLDNARRNRISLVQWRTMRRDALKEALA